MFSWLPQRKPVVGLVGIEFSTDGVGFAHVSRAQGGSCRLESCEFVGGEADPNARSELLQERLEALHLIKAPCNIVLPVNSYQLLLIESPKVPAEELRDAVRWRIKDLIQFPLQDAVVDVFSLPEDSSRGKGAMAYVAATQRQVIEDSIELAESVGLRVSSIDIGELALRNLAECSGNVNADSTVSEGARSDDNRGVAMVKLRQGAGNLALIRQGNLYLSRQFDLPYNAGLLDDLPEDSLVLELQRSLDYYERQMGQVPPSTIYFCGENVTADKITDGMRASLSAEVLTFNVHSHLTCATPFDESLLGLCLGAIGGALRQEVAA